MCSALSIRAQMRSYVRLRIVSWHVDLIETCSDFGASEVSEAKTYVQEEGTVIPKAIAITIGGMTGFLFGFKRGHLCILLSSQNFPKTSLLFTVQVDW